MLFRSFARGFRQPVSFATHSMARRNFGSSSSLFASVSRNQAEVVLVGCGAPNRGMGWYHAVQLIEKKCPSGVLTSVVEPWFLGDGSKGPGGDDFMAWKAEVEADVAFVSSLSALPAASGPRLALISGRTADNPHLVTEAIAAGCTTIYLEKPGAPTVEELEGIRGLAVSANVPILMGYNKNVCKYVTKVREAAESTPNSMVTFVSNNAYEPSDESLGECFERNAEGMLKNMAIHELCLLVSFYDVSVENIKKVQVDKDFSSIKTLKGPSGKEFTDFDKIKFTIWTEKGKGVNGVSVAADRCGGTDSWATVTDAKTGSETFRWAMPDEDDLANVKVLEKRYPDAMPYFFTQDPDYITVKERVSLACVGADASLAEGVASVDQAVETLRVAEFLRGECAKQLA